MQPSIGSTTEPSISISSNCLILARFPAGTSEADAVRIPEVPAPILYLGDQVYDSVHSHRQGRAAHPAGTVTRARSLQTNGVGLTVDSQRSGDHDRHLRRILWRHSERDDDKDKQSLPDLPSRCAFCPPAGQRLRRFRRPTTRR